MKKRIIGLVMAIVMITALVPAVFAADVIGSGKCGDNVTWTVDSDGVLTISGTGDMYDYEGGGANMPPYYSHHESINEIVVEDGVTSLGNFAFILLSNAKKLVIPQSVKYIGYGTFVQVKDLDEIYYNAENCTAYEVSDGFASQCFAYGKKLIIGKSVKKIGAGVFFNCIFSVGTARENAYIDEIRYSGTEEEWKNIDIDYTHNDILKKVVFTENTEKKTNGDIKILLNNRFIRCDQAPVLIDGRTLVPMRAIFEALGAEVEWDDSSKTAKGTKDGRVVSLTIGQNSITVNGTSSELDVPAQIIGERTMIPVRAVAEAYDCIVSWNGYHKYVVISSSQKPYKIEALDSENNVVGTAEFDSYGRLAKLYGDKLPTLKPFCTNINGNCYAADMNSNYSGTFAFDYDENNLIKITETFQSGKEGTTEISYSDNLIQSRVHPEYRDTKEYKYFDGICHLGMASVHANEPDNYKYNENGLVESYKFFSSGHWSYTYTYDEIGNMLSYHYSSGPGTTGSYEYGTDGKIKGASVSEGFTPFPDKYTYRYSDI